MPNKIISVFILLLFIFSFQCCSQSNLDTLTYSAPFDSISIEKHRQNVNKGIGYLLLAKTPSTSIPEKGFYLISTSWYELPRNRERSFKNVDSLLNGKNENIISGDELVPIPEYLIKHYDSKTTCELVKMVFNSDGYYEAPRFYISGNIILAALLKRGTRIEVSDYDGGLSIGSIYLDCVQ